MSLEQISFDQLLTFTRSSTAWYWDGTTYREAQTDEARRPAVPLVQGERAGLLIEGASTNELPDSNDFSGGSDWSGLSDFTVETTSSVFEGETAYRLTNSGASGVRSANQIIGTLTGNDETLSAIVESVDAETMSIGIRDNTASSWVVRGELDVSTGQFSVAAGSGTARVDQLSESGPNGGAVYRVSVTGSGTTDNSRRLILYPTGTGTNTETLILHHAQHEEQTQKTSPIVTGASSVTRSLDVCEYSAIDWFAGQSGAFLVDVICPSDVQSNSFAFEITEDIDNTNRCAVRINSGTIAVVVNNDGGNNSTAKSVSPGERVKCAIGLNGDNVRVSFNGASIETNGNAMPDGMQACYVGDTRVGGLPWNGLIKSIQYRRDNQTDAELQTWSAL